MDFLDLWKLLNCVDDHNKRSNAESVLSGFEVHVLPKLPSLGKSIIHGDFNGANILVSKDPSTDAYNLSGVIDFNECRKTCTINDLAICLAYLMLENINPVYCSNAIEFVGPVIQGYNQILPITADEFDSLYYLALLRCVQSAVVGTHSFKAEPWNTYFLRTPEKAWIIIDALLTMKKDKVDRIWKAYVS